MGATVCAAVAAAPDLELVAAVDPYHEGVDLQQIDVPDTDLRLAKHADALADAGAQVAIDFTVIDAARENLRWCAEHRVHAVVGTTGFDQERVAALARDGLVEQAAGLVRLPA